MTCTHPQLRRSAVTGSGLFCPDCGNTLTPLDPLDVDKRIAELAAGARAPLTPAPLRIPGANGPNANQARSGAELQDDHATLRLVHALRADPDREQVMRLIAQLGNASEGLPIHYTWNKLWWLLYVPSPAKPRAKPRRRKRAT